MRVSRDAGWVQGGRLQRVGAVLVWAHRAAQAAEFDKGPNGDGEADQMQDATHVFHLVANRTRHSRTYIEQDEPPRRLVAIVKALGAQGEADPEQRNVENDEDCHRQEGFSELALPDPDEAAR